jgi:hypothetical protein
MRYITHPLGQGNFITCTGNEIPIAEGITYIFFWMRIVLELFVKERTGVAKFTGRHDVLLILEIVFG